MKQLFALIVFLGLALVRVDGARIPDSPADAARHIVINAKRFAFDPSAITLKIGEPVVLILKADDASHGLRFRELGIDLKASKGKEGEMRFTPEKTGDFVGHCSVFCGAGHGGMTLVLHVVG